MPTRSRRAANTLLAVTLLVTARPAARLLAQDPILPRNAVLVRDATVALGAAFIMDEPLRTFAASHQHAALNSVADALDPLGRAQYLVPALVAAAVLPRFVGQRRFADAAFRVGLGYAAADLTAGAVRVVVARHRPDSTGNAWRFRPFHPQGEWGSMPSAHVTHAFAIAAGVADASGRPWAAGVAYGLASLVGVQRVYRQAHWSSDVVVAATLATIVSRRIVALRF